jgi:AcrR family transcriptional regulator
MPRVTEEHRERRRHEILDAAVMCFERRGLHATTTDDIAEQSGLSAGAIYRYFDSKEAVIEAIASERHAYERSLIADALAGDDPRVAVRTFLGRYFDWLADPAELRRRRVSVYMWAEALHNERFGSIVATGLGPLDEAVEVVRRSMSSGASKPVVDAASLVRVVLALLQGFVLQSSWDPSVDLDGYRAAALATVDALFAVGSLQASP